MNAAQRVLRARDVYAADIAHHLGISPGAVSKHLNGNTADPTPVLMAIIDLAGPTAAREVSDQLERVQLMRFAAVRRAIDAAARMTKEA